MNQYCHYCEHAEYKNEYIYCEKKHRDIPLSSATSRTHCEDYAERSNGSVISGKMYRPREDLTGKRFGRLTVIERAGNVDGNHSRTWLCQCDCGNKKVIRGAVLNRGGAISCGCYAKEVSSKIHTVHGGTKTKLFHVWQGMINRCEGDDENHRRNYKDRGISVCSDWRGSFEKFRDWAIANGYSEELTIDRIDFNGNYEPSNCRWIPESEQHLNTRKTRHFEYNGKMMNLRELESVCGIQMETIRCRLRRGWSVERAVTQDVKKR